MNVGSILKYALLLCISIVASLYHKKKKKERFGELISIGKLTKTRFPLAQVYFFIGTIIINMGFILPCYYNDEYLLMTLYTIGMLVYGFSSLSEIIYNRRKVYIYDNGIEVNGVEMHKTKITSIIKNNDKYIVIRKFHRNIEYEIDNNNLKAEEESKDQIFNRLFPINDKTNNENRKT